MNNWIAITVTIWWTEIGRILEISGYDPLNCKIIGNIADCSNYGLSSFSTTFLGFPDKIKYDKLESLDISNNRLYNLSLDKFSRLIFLYMRNVAFVHPKIKSSPEKKWLSKLKLLEEFDMSGTKFETRILDLNWPRPIVKLTLADMNLQKVLNLEILSNLVELDLNTNNLFTLPLLNETAPIKIINLIDNPIKEIAIEQIAPFCELTAFSIQNTKQRDDDLMNSKPRYNACVHLEQWFLKFFKEIDAGIICFSPAPNDAADHIQFSDKALKARDKCLNQSSSTSILELLLFAVFFSVLFPVLYFANEAWTKHKTRQQAALSATATSSAAKHRRYGRPTRPPSEHDSEHAHSDETYGSGSEYENTHRV